MSKYEVKPYRVWERDDGKIASFYGAVPYHTEEEAKRWQIVDKGFTVYNPLTGQYGIGRKPWETREEAQAFADKNRPSSIGIGD